MKHTPNGWQVFDANTPVLLVTNMPKLPDHPVGKWLFKLSGSAPDLKFNNLAGMVMVRNKRELKRWLAAKMVADTPGWLIPTTVL